MDRTWDCPICSERRDFETAPELAQHLTLWHDEWLVTHQVPRWTQTSGAA